MLCGKVGEFDLWVSSSQMIDLICVLSDGGKRSEMDDVLQRLRLLRTFVDVFPVSDREVDLMLAASWKDPENWLLVETALAIGADAVITRNRSDFPEDLIRVCDCEEFFAWQEEEYGFAYGEVEL